MKNRCALATIVSLCLTGVLPAQAQSSADPPAPPWTGWDVSVPDGPSWAGAEPQSPGSWTAPVAATQSFDNALGLPWADGDAAGSDWTPWGTSDWSSPTSPGVQILPWQLNDPAAVVPAAGWGIAARKMWEIWVGLMLKARQGATRNFIARELSKDTFLPPDDSPASYPFLSDLLEAPDSLMCIEPAAPSDLMCKMP